MLKLRLQRLGKKKAPTYRLIVSEQTKDTQAGSLEILGTYNPVLKEKLIDLKEDRIKHWLSVGAQPSNAVKNLLINAGILKGKKGKAVRISNKRRGKLEEKAAAAEEERKAKEAAAAEAKAAAEAEAKAAEEAKKAEEEAAKAAEAAAKEAPAAEETSEEKPAEDTSASSAQEKEEAEPAKEEAPAEETKE